VRSYEEEAKPTRGRFVWTMSGVMAGVSEYEVTTRSLGRKLLLGYEDEHEMEKTQRVYQVDLVILDLDV
jgi:hypothetical protein